MASGGNNEDDTDQVVPEDSRANIRDIQSHYLRCPSPSRFSAISETETIFLEPIHLSSAVAARKIIREELKPRAIKVKPVPESMLESARQLMVEDLYNRVKDMMDDTSSYNTPCVLDIQRAMVQDRLEAPFNPADEVWPSIFIAEKTVAVNKSRLKRMGITHILNAAHGTGVYTGKGFYKDMNIRYHAVEVDDFPYVDISPHFRKAAEFLDEALLTHKGKVLVNSVMGISRSAVLVAAYLMIFHHMTVMEALLALRRKRPICPNEGFLKQLRQLNEALLQERDEDEQHSDTLSQGSAIEADASQEEGRSVLGAEALSTVADEEEDGKSETSSAAPVTQRRALAEHDQQREDQAPTLPNEQEVEDDNKRTIREWQQRNERYRSEHWWRAQLRREHEESLPAGSCHHLPEDLESVCSVDVQALKEQVGTRGMGRHTQPDPVSTVESTYADMGRQRLRETEKEATNRYSSRHQGEGDMTRTKCGQEDEKSLLSETSALYRSCVKNKDTLTPLERWRVRRIQFGWNKKDTDTETSINDEQDDSEGEEIKVSVLEDVDLTAYQTWKLKQQKKMGAENKDETMELSTGQVTDADNKCSTLFKKKKTKKGSDEDDEDQSTGISKTESKYNPAFVSERLDTPSGLTGRPSCSVIERNQISRNNGCCWQRDIKTPSMHPDSLNAEGARPRNSKHSSFKEQATECSFARGQQEHERKSRFHPRAARQLPSSSQFQTGGINGESQPDPYSERLHHPRLLPAEDFLSNSLTESKSYARMRRSYTTDVEEQEEKEELQDYTVKRKFRHYSGHEDSNTDVKRGGQVKKEKEEDGPSSTSQHRLRSTTKADEDQGGDITTRR
ncbi:inactive dual specificity phosphatase 27-like isoform X1 [Anguilla anguilla]|uniref:inactive dual specificity phosphatase 27-like isoform X1 n=2 Tax=Anguilla anguilla TaxID=7936 RepID=UPI0015A98D4C|nr:inactive dual specificity phosphatase 27-like isoform X1 [Anguilla anguilla]XP_035249054.1 inactive dual specificity phosphatase 27-like isoform X1 [Anguilla anguilla]XP_035249055.1 inactive dual specificity phosphatase 27-like isoform X1 [Anguilla anguilla]XP_035249056.1 inactive dual specificity phosphatase 27-like isoform X1 [Anguilla anguilla]XP_035249057.1 inactive dual specificity phosphatase 27-like isoform X1 [Anguilla anguilla]